jgi:hypothetical protein
MSDMTSCNSSGGTFDLQKSFARMTATARLINSPEPKWLPFTATIGYEEVPVMAYHSGGQLSLKEIWDLPLKAANEDCHVVIPPTYPGLLAANLLSYASCLVKNHVGILIFKLEEAHIPTNSFTQVWQRATAAATATITTVAVAAAVVRSATVGQQQAATGGCGQ